MLFLLIGILLIASVLVLCIKKSRESIFLLGMCLSLMVQFCGILIFIAKKGGYSKEVLQFLFFSLDIKTHVQYLFITLNQIGYMIAVGRYLFPLFLLEMAMNYSMIPLIRKNAGLKKLAVILPALSLILYIPPIYRTIVARWPSMQDIIVQAAYFWILAYVGVAIALLVYEYFAITMQFCRRRFSLVAVCLIALSGLYILYCGQDPGQVYSFYSYGYLWSKGIGYLQYAPSVGGYYLIVVVNIICSVLGFSSLLRYTQGSFQSDRDDMVMERKFDMAKSGASVFVHSIKNQLLANRVLYKRIRQEMERESPDLVQIRGHLDHLQENNELLLSRSEDLYKTVKSQSIRLIPVPLQRLGEDAVHRFIQKHPEGIVRVELASDIEVLVDEMHMSEALYNLLTNGWESMTAAGIYDRPVHIISHSERLYTVIEVRDEGAGIAPSEQKRIFEPFYSSKNSNFNWGMGLYHVHAIVKSHLGSVRVESRPGAGASFYIMLPKYGTVKKRGSHDGAD